MAILEGAVVYVDDEYEEELTHANDFYKELKRAGRPIAAYEDVPPLNHLDHWEGLSLVVLDWNLRAKEGRVPGATALRAGDRKRLVEFLVELLARFYCPVFIVSTDTAETIEGELEAAVGFPLEAIGPRVRIVEKTAVQDSLIAALEAEVRAHPALSVLRTWEQQYQLAKNRMFLELSEISPYWPAHVVRTAKQDEVDPGYELLETLNANLRHRMDPVSFDLEAVSADPVPGDGAASRQVRYGRSVLRATSLHGSEIMPGDFFGSWRASDPADAIWLNLTPACYTVRGRRKPGDPDVRLHLVRGLPTVVPSGTKAFEAWSRQDQRQSRSCVVHVLDGGRAYRFDFTTLQTFAWGTVAKQRLGRLLPPFITHLQQRHAAFLTSEGLPAVLPELYATDVEAGGTGA